MSEPWSWESKLSVFDKRLRAFNEGYRQNLVLLADDRDEISYLLTSYFNSAPTQNFTCVRVYSRYLDRRGFLRAIACSLLRDYAGIDKNLDELLHASEITLPLTASLLKELFKKENVSFLEIIEVINKFINETGKKCILIIEDFLALAELFPSFFQDFSKFLILQRSCMTVLTSSAPARAEKVIGNELNLLFGNFEKLYISEQDFFASYRCLKNSLAPISPSPLFTAFFVNMVGSHSMHYDLMARAIRVHYRADDEGGSLIKILTETLHEPEAYFFQKFIQRIDLVKVSHKDATVIIRILLALAQGYARLREIASVVDCDAKSLAVRLEKLVNTQYITSYGDIYKISDPLFSFWLSRVFKPRFLSALFDSTKSQAAWRMTVENDFVAFKEEFIKNGVTRVLELVGAFKDDYIRTGKHKYNLPLIHKTKIVSYPEKNTHIFIGEGKEIIFAAIKEGSAQDGDVIEFIERARGFRSRRVKKIFIAMDSFSSSARLIAKNHKLVTWDASDINRLRALYNKPMMPHSEDKDYQNEHANSSTF
ncbi:MAG: hypothetical protein ABH865_00940 [Candidatus Omnitrophota bacterium]